MPHAITDQMSVQLAVACEDIREEIGKKVSLMGVFSGDIVVAEFPAQIRIAFFVALSSKKVGEYTMNVRLSADDDAAPLMEGVVKVAFHQEGATGSVVIPLGFLKFEGPTQFRLSLSYSPDQWIEVLQKNIQLGDVR